MLYLIDGNNLIGQAAGPQAGPAQRRLVAELCAFLRGRMDQAVLVFDGADQEGGFPPSHLRGRLRVVWSGTAPADVLLRQRMARSGAPAALTLVSEDRELIAYARARKIRRLGRAAWAELLAQEREEQRARPGPIDVDDWLSFFDREPS